VEGDFSHAWGSAPPLTDQGVHLWWCAVDAVRADALLEACRASLDVDELQRMGRFRFDRDRHRFLVSHAFLRHVLSLYGGREAAEWRYVHGEHGKPSLVASQASSAPAFNLSHSGNAVLIAIARGEALLGVDLEFHRAGRRMEGLAERNFAPAECQRLSRLQGAQRAQRFYDLWSLKEAFIKARGEGLALPLKKFAFLHDDSGKRFGFLPDPELNESAADWQFWSYHRDAQFSAAVAWRAAPGNALDPVCVEAVPLCGWSSMTMGESLRSVRNTGN